MRPTFLPSLIVLAALLLCGCDAPVDHYPPNELYSLVVSTREMVSTQVAADDTTAVVEAWFGTPVQPRWPADQMSGSAAKALVRLDNLERAAGRVYADQDDLHFGLYNEHCVTCHGVSGGGNGPASLLQNPYPRDFRAGVFKWKSTARNARPTRDDLIKILQHGAAGSAMPTFRLIPEQDLEALVDYVIFLSVRGQFERELISGAVQELEYDEARPSDGLSLMSIVGGDEESEALSFARETLDRITDGWARADDAVIQVPPETVADAASIQRGREWFHSPKALCSGCHGQDGDHPLALQTNYDDWTTEFTSRIGITPSDREAVRPFRSAGALRPRIIVPRKLSDGVFRGGDDPQTVYRRLVTGIDGTPMPAVNVSDQPSATGLTSDQIWDIVHYVRSLGESE
ncbi:MAG: c-type cytochrome [Planctomycetales bacterium]|nr:c-type cytochrome [Planctomycetales bacterium]